MNVKSFLPLIFIFIYLGCNPVDKKQPGLYQQSERFIQPPIKGIDLPYEEYSVDAAKGDTLFPKTGSIILFPPNSFLDKNSQPIQGNVQVKYREFKNPIDFYLAGIPMNYDSSGRRYYFASSGMFELIASFRGAPVFVNPANEPEVHLVTNIPSQSDNIYFLDTVQKQWINKGASDVTVLSNSKHIIPEKKKLTENYFAESEPVKPEKANSQSPVIRIVIDPASFKPLLAYDNLKFQLEPGGKAFNTKDTSEEWTNVELLKGESKGLYTVKFTNANRTVSYSAKPVVDDKDYEKAMKVFEKDNAAYKKKLNERLSSEKLNRENFLKDSLTNLKIEEVNSKIEKLNALIESRNRTADSINAVIAKQNKIIDEENYADSMVRSVRIDRFGVWNCDKAIALNSIPILATFKDINGNTIELTHIAVLYKSLKGILNFPDNHLQVMPDAENMILGIYEGRFAYLSFEDFSRLKITADTKNLTFIMTVVSQKDNNANFIKKISGL